MLHLFIHKCSSYVSLNVVDSLSVYHFLNIYNYTYSPLQAVISRDVRVMRSVKGRGGKRKREGEWKNGEGV